VACKKREQLAKLFLNAAIEVEKVSGETEGMPNDAFRHILNEAYMVCEIAWMDLYRHKTEHGC
jgi:hypothetical protein